MGDIRNAFNSTWPDGPTETPTDPLKSDIRALGGLIEDAIAAIATIVAGGGQWKVNVRAASATNVTLATAINGASFGGVTLATGDRIAFIGQTAGSQNGIYVVQASATPVRATDADAASEIAGMAFFVAEGTLAGKGYLCNTAGTITVGTTALSFVLVSDVSSLNTTITDASRRAVSLLTSIGGTADAITATATGLTSDQARTESSSFILVPATTNTGVVTLAINGDTARPVRTRNNGGLVAGDLVAGCRYLIVAEGVRYRVMSPLGIVDATTINAEVVAARQGQTDLAANLTNIGRKATSLLTDVVVTLGTGGAADAITATATGLTAAQASAESSTFILVPTTTNATTVTLSINGDTARPVRTFVNGDLAAGDLVAGRRYLIVAEVARYRILSPLGNRPVRPGEIDAIIAAQAALPTRMATAIAAASEMDAATNLQFAVLSADGTEVGRLSLSKLEEYFMGPTIYTYDASGFAQDQARVVVNYESGLRQFSIANSSLPSDDPVMIGVTFGDREPVIGDAGTITLPPLAAASFNQNDIIAGNINVISSVAGAPFYASFGTTADYNPNSAAAAEVHLARYVGTLSTNARAALKSFYMALHGARVFETMGENAGFYFFYAPHSLDSRLNWLGTHNYLSLYGTPEFSAWNGWLFGTDNALRTDLLLTSAAGVNDHTMWAVADTSNQSAGQYIIGDHRTKLIPNLSGGSRFRTADHNTTTHDTFDAPGGVHFITRTASDRYTASRRKTDTIYNDAADLTSTYPVWLGAQQSASGGPTGFYQGRCYGGGVGFALSAHQRAVFVDALDAFQAAIPGF